MKSLLLVDDAFQSRLVRDIFSGPEYCVDRYIFGARAAEQNRRDQIGAILEKLRARRYDAVILGNPPGYWNPRKSGARNLARLLKRSAELPTLVGAERIFRALLKEARTPLYIVDEMDRPVIDNSKFRFLPRCTLYFKRELPSNIMNAFLYTSDKAESPDSILRQECFRSWAEKLRPISLGISDDEFDRAAAIGAEKKIDLFFAGNFEHRPIRKAGRDALLKLQAEGFRVHISEEHYPEDVYRQRCAESLLCWSPEGFGSDCHRHYEIAACGSVPLRKHSPLYPYAPLRENEECLYYMHESLDLYDAARRALGDPDKLRQMGGKAQARVRECHRYSRLAEYILAGDRASLPPENNL